MENKNAKNLVKRESGCKVLSARRNELSQSGRATVAILGSVARYSCDEGFVLTGNGTRECLDNGTWSGLAPQCQQVSCGDPNEQASLKNEWNWKFILLSEQKTYGSLARLTCPEGEEVVGPLPANIRCKEDGNWSKPKARCATLVSGMEAAINSKDRKEDSLQNTGLSIGLIVGMIGGVVVATVALVYFLLRRRSHQKSELHRSAISQSSSTTTNSTTSSGAGSCQSLVPERMGVGGLLYQSGQHYRRNSCNKKTQTADEGYYSEPKSLPTPISLISNGHYDYPKRGGGTQMLPPNSASLLITPPDYSFQIIPTNLLEKDGRHPSTSSNGSKENIYEEITLGCRKKSPAKTSRKDNVKAAATVANPVNVSALYARVDFDKKRQERLTRQQTRLAPDGASDSADSSPHHVKEKALRANPYPDSPLVVYRELPPIPKDDDSGVDEAKTNDNSLGPQSTTPSLTSTVFTIIDNDLYGDDDFDKKSNHSGVMVDNELYHTTKPWT